MPVQMPDRTLNARQAVNNNFELQFSALREGMETFNKKAIENLVSKNGTFTMRQKTETMYLPT